MITALPETSPEAETVQITFRGWLIWSCAALFYFYEFFVRVAPSVMAPDLMQAFSLSAADLGAAMGVYYMIYSPMQLFAGSFLDRFGAKSVLVPASLVCTAGCFLEVIGHEAFILSAARFCQGLGSAFAFVGTMYLAAEWFPRRMLARLSGLTTSLGMTGAIVGNSGLTRFVELFGWKWAMIAGGVVGLAVTALIFFFVPNRAKTAGNQIAGPAQTHAPKVLSALKIVYSNPQSWYAGIVGTALYMPLSILGALWGVEYITSVTRTDSVAGAGAVSMLYVGWLVGGPIAGWFSDSTGMRRNLLLGASIATFIMTLWVALVHGLSITGAYVLMLVLGFASTSEVVCFVTAVENNPASIAGTAIAATNMMIMLLGGAGEWFFGFLLDQFAGQGHVSGTPYPEAAYHKAILLLPAISTLGLIAAFYLTEPNRKVKGAVKE